MLHGLDLFSGIGGNTIALREYVKTIVYCEADRHAQSVLLSRMADGSIEPAPIWDDVTSLGRDNFDLPIDIIVGGFPCQDISVAGKGAGLEGKRSGLFFEIVRLAKEIKPTFLFLENVPAIRTRGLDTVIQELTEIGYDCRWTMLSASDVGANHKRERWFLLAYTCSERRQQITRSSYEDEKKNEGWLKTQTDFTKCYGEGGGKRVMAYSESQQSGSTQPDPFDGFNWRTEACWWAAEPNVGRVAHGVPLRVDRLKRLGNAVVPAQAKEAFEELMGLKNKEVRGEQKRSDGRFVCEQEG
jgi:DNA (cytosine-5)-methyltransferase 1